MAMIKYEVRVDGILSSITILSKHVDGQAFLLALAQNPSVISIQVTE